MSVFTVQIVIVIVMVCDEERQRIAEEKQRRDDERRMREMQLMTQKAIDKHNQSCQKPTSTSTSSQVWQLTKLSFILTSQSTRTCLLYTSDAADE